MFLTGVYCSSFPHHKESSAWQEQIPSTWLLTQSFIILEGHILKHDTHTLPLPFISLPSFPSLLKDFQGATSLEIDTLFHL